MPAYVAVFSLRRDNTKANYLTLAGVLKKLGPGLTFGDPGVFVPYAVMFPSAYPPSELLDRMREHLYPKDEVVLVRVAEGISVLSSKQARTAFAACLSRV